MKELKYIAYKIKGFDYFIWFKHEDQIITSGILIGCNGWGKNGELTSLKCNEDLIEAIIKSDILQYQ